MLVSEEIIQAASKVLNLDEAALMIQEILGVKTGDVAGICFPEQEEWETLKEFERRTIIRNYIMTEQMYM